MSTANQNDIAAQGCLKGVWDFVVAGGLVALIVTYYINKEAEKERRTMPLEAGAPISTNTGEFALPIHNPASRDYRIQWAAIDVEPSNLKKTNTVGANVFDVIFIEEKTHNRGDNQYGRLV